MIKPLLLARALLVPVAACADEAALASARYAAVDKAVPRATVVKRELEGYSLERGELTAYFQKGVPLKFIAKHYGESGKTTDEFYFWQGRLFFVLSTGEGYDMPIGASSSPGKVVSRAQSRYYFKNGKLWRWIDDNGKPIESGAEFKSHEKDQLTFAREMLAGARGKSKIITAPTGSGMN